VSYGLILVVLHVLSAVCVFAATPSLSSATVERSARFVYCVFIWFCCLLMCLARLLRSPFRAVALFLSASKALPPACVRVFAGN
jgi:hypothetical protein